MVWSRAGTWTAFTDGFRTWIDGPAGVQQRLATDRLLWEREAPEAPPAAPTSEEDTLRLDAAALTSDLGAQFAGQSRSVPGLGSMTERDVTVRFRDRSIGLVLVKGSGPLTLTLDVSGEARAQAGTVRVTLTAAGLNGFAMPADTRQPLERAIQQPVDAATAAQRLNVQSLMVGDGTLTVSGTRT